MEYNQNSEFCDPLQNLLQQTDPEEAILAFFTFYAHLDEDRAEPVLDSPTKEYWRKPTRQHPLTLPDRGKNILLWLVQKRNRWIDIPPKALKKFIWAALPTRHYEGLRISLIVICEEKGLLSESQTLKDL